MTSPVTEPSVEASPAASPIARSIARQVGRALVAVGVTAFAGGLWTVLLSVNLATTPSLPWSVVATSVGLAVAWGILSRRAPEVRGELRLERLPRDVLGWALLAGCLAVVSLVGAWIVLVQLAGVPGRTLPDLSATPPLTVALALAMAAILGALVEEAMFRGYFQGDLEARLGGPAAIGITCVVMAPEHALTQGFLWMPVLFYLAVDAVLGAIAYLTSSILPGVVVHALGLFAFFALIWPGDVDRVPVERGGADATFWIHLGQAVCFGLLALLAFHRLGQTRVGRPRGARGRSADS